METTSKLDSHQAQLQNQMRLLRYPCIYLFCICAAEIVTGLYQYWGIALHFVILFTLLVHSTLSREKPLSDFLTSIAIAPLIRMFSLSTPLAHFSPISWFMIVSIPVFIAVFTIAHLQKVSVRKIFLPPPRLSLLPLDIGLILIAFPIGLLEYQILRPSPIVELNFSVMLAPVLIFIVCSGFLEELTFRGLMQYNAERLAGFPGIVFVSVLFGMLHITNLAYWDVLLAGGAGFLFALVVRKTGSIWGVSVAHGMVNITLFLIAPHMF